MTSEKQLPALVAGIKRETIDEINVISKNYSMSNLVDLGDFERGMMVAQGIASLTKVISDNPQIVKSLMYLQGKKLGFKTDKLYDENIVVNVFVEATLRGLQPAGNQFNIIAGNFYQTQEGYKYALDNLSGLTDFYIEWGDYVTEKSTAKVSFKATWVYKDSKDEMEHWVPVRVNSGAIVDAIYGKAERKVMARVFKKITASSSFFDDKDIDDINTTVVRQKEPERLTAGKTTIKKKDTPSEATAEMPAFGEFKNDDA